jgi:hypothetical protein
MQKLADTVRLLLADHKGLLAMDESNGTCDKRFAAADIPQTEDARRAYRELIITTRGLEECVSGVILYDETIRQSRADGTPFVDVLATAGIVPASRSIRAPRIWRDIRARRSPRDSTDCADVSRTISRWARGSPNGEP